MIDWDKTSLTEIIFVAFIWWRIDDSYDGDNDDDYNDHTYAYDNGDYDSNNDDDNDSDYDRLVIMQDN